MSYNHCGTPAGPESHIRNGESCQVCKDWMKQVGARIVKGKVIAPKPKPVKVTKQRESKPKLRQPRTSDLIHGTTAGYHKHRSRGETPCQPCKDANAEYARALRRKNPPKPAQNPRQLAEIIHGTVAGASLHKYRGEKPCDSCREAMNAYCRKRYYEKRGSAPKAPRTLAPCGTESAYRRHIRANETPCEPCKEASRCDSKERYDRKVGKTA